MTIEINVKQIVSDDVVVVRGLEFPNIIVEGKDEKEAIDNFKKALCYYFTVRKKINHDVYPLSENEKLSSFQMEFIPNG